MPLNQLTDKIQKSQTPARISGSGWKIEPQNQVTLSGPTNQALCSGAQTTTSTEMPPAAWSPHGSTRRGDAIIAFGSLRLSPQATVRLLLLTRSGRERNGRLDVLSPDQVQMSGERREEGYSLLCEQFFKSRETNLKSSQQGFLPIPDSQLLQQVAAISLDCTRRKIELLCHLLI